MADIRFLLEADIAATTAGSPVTIVAAATGKKVVVWQMFIVGVATATVAVTDGSTALQATPIPFAVGAQLNLPYTGAPWFKTTISAALKLTVATGSGSVTGRLYYTLE